MADSEFTSREQEVFRLLILLNGTLKFIGLRLQEMSTAKILTLKYLSEVTVVTEQVDKYLKQSNITT